MYEVYKIYKIFNGSDTKVKLWFSAIAWGHCCLEKKPRSLKRETGMNRSLTTFHVDSVRNKIWKVFAGWPNADDDTDLHLPCAGQTAKYYGSRSFWFLICLPSTAELISFSHIQVSVFLRKKILKTHSLEDLLYLMCSSLLANELPH